MAGLVQFIPNEALEERQEQPEDVQPEPNISALAAYCHKLWGAAREAKRDVELKMLDMSRQKRGEYHPDKLAAIKETNGCEEYIQLTKRKCRDARAWIMDIVKPLGRDKSWGIEPTPMPDINPEIMGYAEQEAMAQAGMPNGPVPPEAVEQVKRQAQKIHDDQLDLVRREAKKRALRMERVIEDQLAESDFEAIFHEFLDDVVDLKAGILKGPVLRNKVVSQGWIQGEAGWEPRIERATIPMVDRVDPFRFFPGPYSRNAQDSYTVEWHDLSVKQLLEFRGVDGYDADAIDQAIDQFGRGNGRWLEAEMLHNFRLARQGNVTQNTALDTGIDVLEYWAPVRGELLEDWGFVGLESWDVYDVNCWVVGPHVIRCIINPDPLRKNPYHVTSFIRVNGSIWGEGLPETIADDQNMSNMLGRAIGNNAAFGSLPQIDVNELRLAASDDMRIYPGKLWRHDGGLMAGERPVSFYQPPIVIPALLAALTAFIQQADANSGVPAYAHGDARVGGAGNTKGGLSMLVSMASRGILGVVTNISDNVLNPLIQGFYSHNMLYHPDPDIKGDCKIAPAGVAAMMQREQAAVRISEFAAMTANPIDMPIIRTKGRAELLRALAGRLDIPADKIIPSEEEIMRMEQEQPQAAKLDPLQQAQLNRINAETALKNIEALYSAMQTAATAANVPGIAPVADAIARSAGFQDQDEPPIYPEVPGGAGSGQADMPSNTHPMFPANPDAGMMRGMQTQTLTDNNEAGRQ